MKIGKYQITSKEIIIFLSAVIVAFNLWCLGWLPPSPFMQRGFFLVIFILLAYLLNPQKTKIGKISMSILTLMAIVGSIYLMIFEEKLIAQYYCADGTDIYFFIIFCIGFAAVLTHIAGGWVILGLIVIGIFYILLGQYIPGYFGHLPFSLNYVTSILYTDIHLGVFGGFADIACRLVSIFVLFAALLVTTGLGDLMTAFATWIAGNATGGPAKISIFSSGAFGMLSGSAVSNVIATGSFTIPLMKNIGYSSSAAASVEALASSGGTLMPPIMGVAAFVMADMLGIPYLHVCIAALIPAFLWYFSLYLIVHYYALRQGIRKQRPSREEFIAVIKAKFHLAFSIPVLVGALVYFSSAEQAAFWTVVFLLIIANLRKGTRLTKAKVAEFLEMYARMFTSLLILIYALGIFVSVMLGSGIHVKLGTFLLGGIEQLPIILLISAALTIVFGMAVPPMAAYIAAVVMLAPILAELGYNLLVIHMFIFYIATLAPITPPVCLASFAAAKIAESDMMKTGIETTIRGLPLWIIPFSIFKKELLFGVGTPISTLVVGVAMLAFGVYVFTIGAEGYYQRNLNTYERIIGIVCGIMIVQPVSDFYAQMFVVVGLLSLAYIWLSNLSKKSRSKKFS